MQANIKPGTKTAAVTREDIRSHFALSVAKLDDRTELTLKQRYLDAVRLLDYLTSAPKPVIEITTHLVRLANLTMSLAEGRLIGIRTYQRGECQVLVVSMSREDNSGSSWNLRVMTTTGDTFHVYTRSY
jgi:hypothetical protein